LGKVNHWDAFFYVTAQFVGAFVGVGVAATMFDACLADPAVSYAATVLRQNLVRRA
jgi:aquaporin Z